MTVCTVTEVHPRILEARRCGPAAQIIAQNFDRVIRVNPLHDPVRRVEVGIIDGIRLRNRPGLH